MVNSGAGGLSRFVFVVFDVGEAGLFVAVEGAGVGGDEGAGGGGDVGVVAADGDGDVVGAAAAAVGGVEGLDGVAGGAGEVGGEDFDPGVGGAFAEEVAGD